MLRQVLTYDLCKHANTKRCQHIVGKDLPRERDADERLEAKDMDEGRRYLKEKTDA